MKKSSLLALAIVAAAFAGSLPLQAQWQTQSILVKPGWSAIYLHVDAGYDKLDDLVGADLTNPISQLWLWQPSASTIQYVTGPQAPVTSSTEWVPWRRITTGMSSTLTRLVPNGAYLVFSTATTNYMWTLKGKPVAPSYTWATTGENFLGFPTPPSLPPTFDHFLSLGGSLESLAQIYAYQGGDLTSSNPAPVQFFTSTLVNRGQAYWIRAGTYYNNYFGPFTATPQDLVGVDFGDSSSQCTLRLMNPTANPVTVTMQLLPSESAPTNQPDYANVPPVLVRGALITSNLSYGFTNLTVNNTVSWTLPPQGQNGSSQAIVLGLNRYTMSGAPGTLYGGILKLTDSYGLSEVDLPVSAQVASYAGLWVGEATVSQVQAYLKSFQRDGNNNPVMDTNGAYIVTGIDTNLGPTSSAFPLRLIVHNDGSHAYLLQRVFYGSDPGSNIIVTTSEAFLDPAQLGAARRITAVHLPWTPNNTAYSLGGPLTPGALLSTTVTTTYDDQSSNPFLHTYHPDHDNLDATFQVQLAPGQESYGISRAITLNITPPGNDFNSLTQAGQSFSGAYTEAITMTGAGTRVFNVGGAFSLNRVSAIATLTH